MRPLRTTAATVILAITAVTVPSAWQQHRRASCVPAVGVYASVQDRENGGSPRPSEAVVSRSRAGEPSTSRDTPPGDHMERLIPQAPAPGDLASGSAVRPSPAGEPPLEASAEAIPVLLSTSFGLAEPWSSGWQVVTSPARHRPALCLRSWKSAGPCVRPSETVEVGRPR